MVLGLGTPAWCTTCEIEMWNRCQILAPRSKVGLPVLTAYPHYHIAWEAMAHPYCYQGIIDDYTGNEGVGEGAGR